MTGRMPERAPRGQVSRRPRRAERPAVVLGALICPEIDPERRGRPGRGCSARGWVAGALLLSVIAGAGCKGEPEDAPPPKGEQERTLVTLQSFVYATTEESRFAVAGRIKDQVKSAFGALKALRVTASNKELANEIEGELYREPLVMLHANGRETVVLRVWFRYSDEVLAPSWVQRGVPILVGGLHRQDDARFTDIVTVCTPNTARERELRGRLQVAFDGSLPGCQDAILAEQSRIDAARVRLDSPEDEIVPEELERVYVPVVARLMGKKASQMGKYPRFEAVIPQAARSVVASAPSGRTAGADLHPSPEPYREPGRPEGEVAAAAGTGAVVVAPAGAARRASDEDEEDPDAPPDPQAGVPVIAAGGPKGPGNGNPVQPRGGVAERSFNWEDLGDKKYWVLWIAVFALYPLLRRRPSDG